MADAYSHAKDKVIIAKVDADGAGKPLGKKFGVTGYPSQYHYALREPSGSLNCVLALKWFGPDGGEPEKYEGGRDADALLM